MNAFKSMTGIVVAVTVAAGSGCAGDPSGPSTRGRVGFTGTVWRVRDPPPYAELGGRIEEGQTVEGYYVYDMRAEDSSTWPYHHTTPPYGISFTVNGLTFESDPTNVNFTVTKSDGGWGWYWMESWNNRVRVRLGGAFEVGSIHWYLDPPTGNAELSVSGPNWGGYEVRVAVTEIQPLAGSPGSSFRPR